MTIDAFCKKQNAAAAGLWKKPVRGKRGKPKAGFPLFPPPLESRTTRGIPLFPQPRLLLVSHEPNNLFLITKIGVGPNETIERGQIKLTEPTRPEDRSTGLDGHFLSRFEPTAASLCQSEDSLRVMPT